MKPTRFILILAFCFAASLCFAANPFTGTWKLDESKSKLGPGASHNSTVIYSQEGDKAKTTIEGTTADGKPFHNEWVGKWDGKDYPVIGGPEDSRAVTKVNDRTLDLNIKKDGKVIATGRVVVSPDGKTRTVTLTSTDAQGKKVKSTLVYDKQ